MIFIPKIGRVVIITGKIAQCIAQATDVATPIKSQLSLNGIGIIKFDKQK